MRDGFLGSWYQLGLVLIGNPQEAIHLAVSINRELPPKMLGGCINPKCGQEKGNRLPLPALGNILTLLPF